MGGPLESVTGVPVLEFNVMRGIRPEQAVCPVHLVLSAGLHTAALLTGLQNSAVPMEWLRDFSVLMGAAFTCSIALVFVKRQSARLLLFILRITVFFIIGIPFGSSITVEGLILTSIILDFHFQLPPLRAIWFSLLLISAVLIFQQDFSIYNLRSGKPDGIDLILLGLWGGLVNFFTGLFNLTLSIYLEKKQEIEYQYSVIDELIGANRGYLEYASSIEAESTERERKRIITELHDIVGQSFTNILAITNASKKHPPGEEELEDVFSVIRSQAQSGLMETRSVLYRLHTFKEIRHRGLKELHNLISIFERSTKVTVKTDWSNYPWNPGSALNAVVYKVVRESLINSFRHGKATLVDIHFWKLQHRINIHIQDNGTGASIIKKGIGLKSMEDEVKKQGGTIRFEGSAGGFGVHFQLPAP